MSNVSTSKFASSLTQMLNEYTEEVVEGINEEVVDTANNGAELLQQTLQPQSSKSGSAKPMTRRQWKRYAKSWQVKRIDGVGYIKCSIHNKKYYRLTHLLELGHATRDGKRTREFRHIEPIELYCVDRLEKNIPKIIKKGGKL